MLEWVRENPKRVSDLEKHRSRLLQGALEGQSGAITSGSGNGVSFAQTAGLSAVDVSRAIRLAIQWYENGQGGSTRSVAFFG